MTSTLAAAQSQSPPTTGRLTGSVLESGTNAPIADARVTLLLSPVGRPALPVRPLETTSDQNGRFTFEGLVSGLYALQVQKAGFATPLSPSGSTQPPRTVNVVAGQTQDAPALVLSRGGAISGLVFDASGAPLLEARVSVLRRVNQVGGEPRFMPAGNTVSTNDLGEYRLYGLAPGTYYVQASPRSEYRGVGGGAPQARSTLLAPTYFPGLTDPAGAQAVTVTAGQTTPNISIKLIQAAAFQISGIVVDENGAPASGAAIMLYPAAGSSLQFTSPNLDRVRTDSAGRFTVPNLVGGTYTIGAALPVVINRSASGPSGIGGITASATMGIVGAPVMTETSNGVTTEYRANPADQVRVVVSDNVSDLRLVARRPQR